jgi:NAD(P)-dependent dehydrogenase (short-subunit alcohol dehydrogenase family)
MTSEVERLFGIAGKCAVVTGGSRGIGAMIARGYLRAGAKVIISARKADQVALAEQELSKFGWCKGFVADLSTVAGCKALSQFVHEEYQQLGILVNNAGATWGTGIDDFSEDAWDKVMDTNVKSIFFLTQALLPLLRKAGHSDDPARVINIGSIDGLHVNPLEHYPYSASKAAVHHLTKALAKRLGREHIAVNAIAPGPFESKMMAATLAAAGEVIAAHSVFNRIGRPDDMAGAALFLASRASSYITGSVLAVDGGIATTA